MQMIAPRIQFGDTIGICTISHVAEKDEYQYIIDGIRRKGFQVKEAEHLYSDTYGYLATPQERAADFNQLIADPEVKLIFFGGGEGSNEILPLIDYDNIRKNPKMILSFSDGTTVLDAIWSKTCMETYYGQCPSFFVDISSYDESNFVQHLVRGDVKRHISNSEWKVQWEGKGSGILIGGYSRNFAMLLNTPYFQYDKDESYLLFIEDHEMFGDIAYVSAMLTHIEQSGIMENVRGLLFGNYSDQSKPMLYNRLKRIGEHYQIPTVYCDDFGHGSNHAILPIGHRAVLNTSDCSLSYLC